VSIFKTKSITILKRVGLFGMPNKQAYYIEKTSPGFKYNRSFSVYNILGSFAFLLFLSSCEKVIDVKLPTADNRYVIEAILTNETGICRVLVSQTQSLSDASGFAGVSGAQITLSDNNGTPVIFTEKSKGIYESSILTGQPGQTYRLTIAIDGKVYSATSTMPALVPFDSVYISERSFGGESSKFATVKYKDPTGKGNAYRFVQFINGVKTKTLFVNDDALIDGRTVNADLLFFDDASEDNDKGDGLNTGDQVEVHMQTIDPAIYKYWYSLSQGATGDNETANPANPITNLTGGALGYFSAHTIQKKTFIVQ